MADQDKQASGGRVKDDDRFNYIGFDVFPGKPRDLFKSESEKAQLVDVVVKKRSKGDVIREQCSLLLARVTGLERNVMIAACLAALLSLVLPWYSAYNEVEIKPTVTQQAAPADDQTSSGSKVQTITGVQIQKKMERHTSSLMGIGGILSIGSAGGAMFSSGFALILTALLMLAYTLACIGLPVYLLMKLFKAGKLTDEFALELKKVLRLNWIPILVFVAAFLLSFLGADYGSGASGVFSSLGTSYGPGAFLGTLTWGIYVSLGAFAVLALKGIEI
jgi:hypothetical protein